MWGKNYDGFRGFVYHSLNRDGSMYIYYDSFIEYKGNKLHKLLSYIVIVMLLIGNALLFEIIPEQYYPIKLLPYITIHIFFIKLCGPMSILWTQKVELFYAA